MQIHLLVVADMNDADYVRCLTPIDDETLEQLKPLIQAIKDFKPYKNKYTHHHNFPEDPREDMGEKTIAQLYPGHEEALEILSEYMDHGVHGVHTITEIKILEVSNTITLLGNE